MAKRKGFEGKSEPLLPARRFYARVLGNLVLVIVFIAFALGVGMAGYMYFEHMSAVDAFANAAMILSGMGPLGQLSTNGGKIFAGLYALCSGIFFIFAAGLLLSPLLHRLIHRFHLDDAA